MDKFEFNNFVCIELNHEQSVFMNSLHTIIVEEDIPYAVPMSEYNFYFIPKEDGDYEVNSFSYDKFGMTEITFKGKDGKVKIIVHYETFNKNDFVKFKLGTKYIINIKDV